MALTFEQFRELHSKGLEPDQIAAFEKLTAPEIAEESKLIKAADAVNAVYERYKNLPVLKQATQLVGLGAGAAGGAIGAVVGGVGETGIQAIQALQGKGFDQEKIIESSKRLASETAKFGFEIGREGAAAAPLGALPRLITAPLAGAQVVKGGQEVKRGIETSDATQVFSGALALGTGVVAGRAALKGRQPVVSEVKSARQARLAKQPEKLVTEATNIYRDVLKPTQGELKNVEIRRGKDINETYKFMAEEGIVVGKDVGNRLDTTEARKVLQERIDEPNQQLQQELASRPQRNFNLYKLGAQAKREIDAMKLSALEKQGRKADVDEIIVAEVDQRGTPNIDGTTLNEVKQGLWKMGYNQQKPTTHKTARLLGHLAKEQIIDSYKEVPIEQLSNRIGKYAESISLLENAHGRVIKGGQLGQKLGGITGAIIGGSIKIPIIGPTVGQFVGTNLVKWLSSPERLTTKAAAKVKKAQQIERTLESKSAKERIL